MSTVPAVTLNNGSSMPQLGFGVYQVPEDETQGVVSTALELGYRSIDTASLYRNEEGTGRAIAASGIPREELFVTTKLWNTDQGYDAARHAFEVSLAKLGLEYVDLYLIHWPLPARDLYVETWRALEKIYELGRAKAVGVSNFHTPHLRRLIAETDVVPAVNQIELHPKLQQEQLRTFHADAGIATEAWSPLGRNNGVLDDDAVTGVARKHGRTPAQVVLRWHLQLGDVVIPKSVTPARMRENLDVFGFELDGEDMAAIGGMETGERVGPDPDTLN
ncbi:Aldo/keto reductase [Streptomyces sp. WMMB 714]|uniref:aldo/keto reductase n=1 Tax=Streptomyces sp. WMMB 714 TaxID=1286822 RepID=UPI0005F7D4AD|nr:aldo/keto reductase [Streptomyces sp. WMMB 714]SCK06260.1 Aldo/keto reductase [Streptomyces sp. WMMB 714]